MFLTGLLTAFFQIQLPGNGATHTNHSLFKTISHRHDHRPVCWGTSLAELSSSQVTLDPVKLEVKLTTQPQDLSSFRPLSQHPKCFLHSQHSHYIKYYHTEDRGILLNFIYDIACHAFTKTLPSILISSLKKMPYLAAEVIHTVPLVSSLTFNYGSSHHGLLSVWEYTRDTCVLEPLNMLFPPKVFGNLTSSLL